MPGVHLPTLCGRDPAVRATVTRLMADLLGSFQTCRHSGEVDKPTHDPGGIHDPVEEPVPAPRRLPARDGQPAAPPSYPLSAAGRPPRGVDRGSVIMGR